MNRRWRLRTDWNYLRRSRDRTVFFLCHGDLDQHHILIGSQDVAFIEFNQMHLGDQMTDLYRFMRKAMEKHGWDPRLGAAMLEAYDRVLPTAGRIGPVCIICFSIRRNTGSS